MRPSPRALFLAACGLPLAVLPALGLSSAWFGWALFWGLLLGLVATDAILAPRRSDLHLEVNVPDLLYVGASAKAALVLAPLPAARSRVELRLDLSSHLQPTSPLRGTLGARKLELSVELRALKRGTGVVEAVWIRADGPLGLARRTVRLPVDRAAPIVPNVPQVRGSALDFWGAREHEAGLKIERFLGDGSEFDSLREFMPGFDRRTIDWKASARHMKLLSRQHRAERSHQIVLAIDTGRLMAEPLAGLPRLDHAVHAALLMGLVSVRAGDRVGMFAFDERPRSLLAPRGGMAAYRHLLAASAELDYGASETNFTLGLSSLVASLSRRSLVIVLTDFVDTITAELVVDNLLRLSRRHLVLFAALRDPLLDELATRAPRAGSDIHRAVVADSMLYERELVMRRLARHGIGCIDALPSELGVALCNRYLEIKRRELV